MKINKEAQRTARQLMKLTLKNGRVDEDVARRVVIGLRDEKSRGYLAKISAYLRLVRLELERRRAVIESAVELDAATKSVVESNLQKKYDGGLTTEFKVTPELIGGMRIRVGSDVWDGSVKGRLDRLRDRIG